MRKGGYLHTPSTIYTKQLYSNAHCREMNEKFRLFEDDPTWYSMIKNTDALSLEFSFDSLVLYRMHSGSVSNTINPVFLEELHRLNKIYMKDTKGFEKFLIKCKDESYGKRFTLFNLFNKISSLKLFA